MASKLEALRELQGVEQQIADIRRQIQQKERLVEVQRQRTEVGNAALEQERRDILKAQSEFDALDLDIKTRGANLAKLREQLNRTKTNKEYAALLEQLNNEKADNTRLEQRGLELMTRLEERRAALGQQQEALGQQQARLNDLQAQLEQTRTLYAPRLAQLGAQRESSATLLDAPIRGLFDKLAERYDGEALAELQKPNPRRDEYVCGGCHISVRAELYNALRVRGEVLTCRACGRILYLAG